MKIMVTKKEYEVAKALGFKMVKELSKEGEITGYSEESFEDYEKRFNDSFKSEKGKWGKLTVRKDDSIGNNKIILDIDEGCIKDIINELYSPIAIASIKCAITLFKTFNTVFEKCKKSFNKVYLKWFDEDFKSYVIMKYINDDSDKGDFARDLKLDKCFPKTCERDIISNHLDNASNLCCIYDTYDIEAVFNTLWDEYSKR